MRNAVHVPSWSPPLPPPPPPPLPDGLPAPPRTLTAAPVPAMLAEVPPAKLDVAIQPSEMPVATALVSALHMVGHAAKFQLSAPLVMVPGSPPLYPSPQSHMRTFS